MRISKITRRIGPATSEALDLLPIPSPGQIQKNQNGLGKKWRFLANEYGVSFFPDSLSDIRIFIHRPEMYTILSQYVFSKPLLDKT